jgi:hypothetical protein
VSAARPARGLPRQGEAPLRSLDTDRKQARQVVSLLLLSRGLTPPGAVVDFDRGDARVKLGAGLPGRGWRLDIWTPAAGERRATSTQGPLMQAYGAMCTLGLKNADQCSSPAHARNGGRDACCRVGRVLDHVACCWNVLTWSKYTWRHYLPVAVVDTGRWMIKLLVIMTKCARIHAPGIRMLCTPWKPSEDRGGKNLKMSQPSQP